MNFENVYQNFYRIPRVGAKRINGDGGPFGFDIWAAVMVDYAIRKYKCDAIIETGCFVGDTTEYLARQYPKLQIITCDVEDNFFEFTSKRLDFAQNTKVILGSSQVVVSEYAEKFSRPFFYLDAHWYDYWPLDDELQSINNGIICIDDFDIRNGRYGFDVYKGRTCGPEIFRPYGSKFSTFYTNNPKSKIPFPCLQPGRRSGRAFVSINEKTDFFAENEMFVRHTLSEIPVGSEPRQINSQVNDTPKHPD